MNSSTTQSHGLHSEDDEEEENDELDEDGGQSFSNSNSIFLMSAQNEASSLYAALIRSITHRASGVAPTNIMPSELGNTT